jgi:hypothetical protein
MFVVQCGTGTGGFVHPTYFFKIKHRKHRTKVVNSRIEDNVSELGNRRHIQLVREQETEVASWGTGDRFT